MTGDYVLVTGASSQLGVFLLPRLEASGFNVLAFSRRAPLAVYDASERVRWQNPGTVFDEGIGMECLPAAPVRHMVSCGPLELASALITKCVGLQRVVAFSSSSVLTKTGSANRAEREQMAKIQEQEIRLKKLSDDRGITLVLLRPTLIYGCGLDRNISMLARFGRRFGFIPLARKARGLRQPVHADDLAAVAVHALSIESATALESVACGGSTLTYREMVEKIGASCEDGVRPLALPSWMLLAAVGVVSMLPAFRNINIEMVRRQGRNMVFDDTALRQVLDYRPRPFEPGRADFQIPEYAARLQLPVQVN